MVMRGVCLGGLQAQAIQVQKQAHSQESCALIAIHKRMVLGQTNPIARGQRGRVRETADIRISHNVLRPHQGQLQQAFVTHTFTPAVRGEALPMEQNQRLLANPAPTHFAN
jgi:hypothetical protein